MQPFSKPYRILGIALLILGMMILLGSATLVAARPLSQTAAEGQEVFNQQCAACHTIGGGKLVGPDLANVTQLRDMEWLRNFIAAPDQMFAEKDPTAMELLAEYNNFPMPNLGLTQAQVDSVLAYLENPDAAGQAQAPAVVTGTGDPRAGEQIFTGAKPLANGGTSCIACHSSAGISALGGGTLGPDLTQVAVRLGDQGLASALQTLPFPTMQGIFANRPLTQAEQDDLYAYFQSTKNQPVNNNAAIWFWGAGGAGALLLFGLLAFYWPRQRSSLAESLRNENS